MTTTARDEVSKRIIKWVIEFQNESGWPEHLRRRINQTLYFDDPFDSEAHLDLEPFPLREDISQEHLIITQYIELENTAKALKQCEFYFRRFPFRGLPITHHEHIRNICEMYFGRFYEFKERIKEYCDSIHRKYPKNGMQVGKFIRDYEREFSTELRTRNMIHHTMGFSDISIERLSLVRIFLFGEKDKANRQIHTRFHREVAKKWAHQARSRAQRIDEFLEAIAVATIRVCDFLKKD